jgi:hypothetical protein
MRLRIIKISPEGLVQMLQGKNSASNLPNDIEILDLKMDLFSKQVSILIRSDCFDDVPEAIPIPEFVLTVPKENRTSSSKTPVPLKPEVNVEPKPTVSKLASSQSDPNRWALKMEKEFNPDQQKLLNFTVKGDVVVVKPITFLKAEWEDINEIVRSLGGKWVKGDIISYWEIPLQ